LAGEQYFAERLAPLLESLAERGQYATRLAVYDRDRVRVLHVDEVDWIGAEQEEVVVHVGEEIYPIRRTLSQLEARLDPACFFRAHRSAIVNLDRVQEIIPWFKGSHRLRLTTGAEVDLSRRRARALREILRW
jgi:DNA-binding LytR/AlgR family response regulator